MAKEIDRIELEVSGRASEVPISKVIEESGSLVAEGLQAVFGSEEDDSASEETGVGELFFSCKIINEKFEFSKKFLVCGL